MYIQMQVESNMSRKLVRLIGSYSQSPEKLLTFLQTKASQKANLPHKTIKSGCGLGVVSEFLLFFVDLPPVSGRATVIFS